MSVHAYAMQAATLLRNRLDVAGLERIHEAQIEFQHDQLVAASERWPWRRKRAVAAAEAKFREAVAAASARKQP